MIVRRASLFIKKNYNKSGTLILHSYRPPTVSFDDSLAYQYFLRTYCAMHGIVAHKAALRFTLIFCTQL